MSATDWMKAAALLLAVPAVMLYLEYRGRITARSIGKGAVILALVASVIAAAIFFGPALVDGFSKSASQESAREIRYDQY